MSKRDEYPQIKKGNGGDPFKTYDRQFQNMPNRPYEMVASSAVASVADQNKRATDSGRDAQAVALPKHLFIPEDAQSMLLRSSKTAIASGTTSVIMTFTAPAGATTLFTSYVIQASAFAANSFFTPKVNGIRVLPFHGDPNTNFLLNVYSAASPFLSIPAPCLLQLQPGDILTWEFSNNSGAALDASVFMDGYIDMSTERINGRTGG